MNYLLGEKKMADKTMTPKGQEESVPTPNTAEKGTSPIPDPTEQGSISTTDPTGEVQENVLTRASNIPLVSSTYDKAAAAYASTKETHPYIKAVLDLAEKSVKQVSDVAAGSAQPLLSKLEPQIAAASHYASKGLDKLEEKLPILHQTADEVISDAQELVSSKVAGAKEVVAKTVQGGKEMVVETAMSRAEAVLDKSERLLDYYLPMTDEELAKLAESLPDVGESADTAAEASKKQGYFVRLGSLSTKLRQRAYRYAVAKLKIARDNIKEAFFRLHSTIGQIENTKQSEKPKEEEEKPNEVESQTLAMSSQIIQQLQKAYKNLTAGIEGLPVAFQQNMLQAYRHMEELHSYFTNAQSFSDLSSSLLKQAKDRAIKAQEYVDDILEYVMHNTPLSWLVGPLLPAAKYLPAKSDVEEKMEEKMKAIQKEDLKEKDLKEKEDLKAVEPSQ